MPTASGKSVGNALAAVANYHSKNATRKRNMNALRQKLALHTTLTEPVYQFASNSNNNNKKNCGPEPKPKFLGTKKNPVYANWQACTSAAAGGKRRTRRRR